MELAYHIWNQSENDNDAKLKLVLLHGMGGTGSLWRPVAASLERTMTLLSPDQRGHGKSRIPHVPGSRKEVKYTPLDYGQDVIDTLETLKFHPTWILGHSMGVRTAAAAGHLKPDWIQGLILVDLGFSGVAGGGLGDGLAQFLKLLPAQFPSREEAKLFMSTYCPDPSISHYLMAVSTRNSQGQIEFPFDHAALIQTIAAARDVSVRKWIQELGEKEKPILVLRGAQSLVWSHEEFEKEKEYFSHLPSILFKEVPHAGHGLPFEQRIVFIEMIRAFTSESAKHEHPKKGSV